MKLKSVIAVTLIALGLTGVAHADGFYAGGAVGRGFVDENIDGLSILMPRFGFTWEPRSDLSVRGGMGIYSGGNPFVWISNSYSNDGITNVQERLNNFNSALSVLDGTIPFQGTAGPGRAAPQALFDNVANTTAANGSTSRVVLLDPSYDQPGEFKLALGAT